MGHAIVLHDAFVELHWASLVEPEMLLTLIQASLFIAQELERVLEDVEIRSPQFPVIQNADAQSHDDPVEIRAALVAQVSRPVRWVGCVEGMRSLGADRFLEYGPGRTLSGLIKKMDRSLETVALDRTGAMEALV